MKLRLTLALFLALPLTAHADEVSDALQAAVDAYAAGDLAKTSENMTFARQALDTRQSALLVALLPPAPDGWTMTVSEDFAAGFAVMGGGAGTEARYENADQSVSFTISYIADNPMVASMGAMLGNAQMMAMMGKVAKVGDQAVLDTGDSVQTLVANRVLVQAQGAPSDVVMPVVQLIDFAKLGAFDKP